MSLATFVFQVGSPLIADARNKDGEMTLLAVYSEKGLRGLSVADKRLPCPFCHGLDDFKFPKEIVQRFEALKEDLLLRLNGEPLELPWDAFDLDDHTDFHVRVWKALHDIPYGQTATYGEIAHAAGSPHAVRAAGQACGANPVILFIPCHRVIPANGGLGGFGAGISWKKRLLSLEGVDWKSFTRRASKSKPKIRKSEKKSWI